MADARPLVGVGVLDAHPSADTSDGLDDLATGFMEVKQNEDAMPAHGSTVPASNADSAATCNAAVSDETCSGARTDCNTTVNQPEARIGKDTNLTTASTAVDGQLSQAALTSRSNSSAATLPAVTSPTPSGSASEAASEGGPRRIANSDYRRAPGSVNGSATTLDRDEKVRMNLEIIGREKQKKYEEMLEAQRHAEEHRHQQEELRRQKIDESKRKEEERQKMVEERRLAREQEEEERRRATQKKKHEKQAARLQEELAPKHGRHEAFGFGSSTRRFEDIMLIGPGRRSASISNLASRQLVSGDGHAGEGNICPRFREYHRRCLSAHAGSLASPDFTVGSGHALATSASSPRSSAAVLPVKPLSLSTNNLAFGGHPLRRRVAMSPTAETLNEHEVSADDTGATGLLLSSGSRRDRKVHSSSASPSAAHASAVVLRAAALRRASPGVGVSVGELTASHERALAPSQLRESRSLERHLLSADAAARAPKVRAKSSDSGRHMSDHVRSTINKLTAATKLPASPSDGKVHSARLAWSGSDKGTTNLESAEVAGLSDSSEKVRSPAANEKAPSRKDGHQAVPATAKVGMRVSVPSRCKDTAAYPAGQGPSTWDADRGALLSTAAVTVAVTNDAVAGVTVLGFYHSAQSEDALSASSRGNAAPGSGSVAHAGSGTKHKPGLQINSTRGTSGCSTVPTMTTSGTGLQHTVPSSANNEKGLLSPRGAIDRQHPLKQVVAEDAFKAMQSRLLAASSAVAHKPGMRKAVSVANMSTAKSVHASATLPAASSRRNAPGSNTGLRAEASPSTSRPHAISIEEKHPIRASSLALNTVEGSATGTAAVTDAKDENLAAGALSQDSELALRDGGELRHAGLTDALRVAPVVAPENVPAYGCTNLPVCEEDVTAGDPTTKDPLAAGAANESEGVLATEDPASEEATPATGLSFSGSGLPMAAVAGLTPGDPAVDAYKTKMAEKRRQAREKAEKDAEAERQKQEDARKEVEEALRKEQEEQRRFEEEENRLADEARRVEEERLRRAVEEAEARRRSEIAVADAERRLKEETDRKTKEDSEKRERALREKIEREENERLERKKKLETIMKRVKTDSPAHEAKKRDDKPPEAVVDLSSVVTSVSGAISISVSLTSASSGAEAEKLNGNVDAKLQTASRAAGDARVNGVGAPGESAAAACRLQSESEDEVLLAMTVDFSVPTIPNGADSVIITNGCHGLVHSDCLSATDIVAGHNSLLSKSLQPQCVEHCKGDQDIALSVVAQRPAVESCEAANSSSIREVKDSTQTIALQPLSAEQPEAENGHGRHDIQDGNQTISVLLPSAEQLEAENSYGRREVKDGTHSISVQPPSDQPEAENGRGRCEVKDSALSLSAQPQSTERSEAVVNGCEVDSQSPQKTAMQNDHHMQDVLSLNETQTQSVVDKATEVIAF